MVIVVKVIFGGVIVNFVIIVWYIIVFVDILINKWLKVVLDIILNFKIRIIYILIKCVGYIFFVNCFCLF